MYKLTNIQKITPEYMWSMYFNSSLDSLSYENYEEVTTASFYFLLLSIYGRLENVLIYFQSFVTLQVYPHKKWLSVACYD